MTNCETGLHHSHIAVIKHLRPAGNQSGDQEGREFVLTSEETAPGQTSGQSSETYVTWAPPRAA